MPGLCVEFRHSSYPIYETTSSVSTAANTDDRGLYLLPGLRPSTYTIQAEAPGFRTAESQKVVLAVDQQATLNFRLKPSFRALLYSYSSSLQWVKGPIH